MAKITKIDVKNKEWQGKKSTSYLATLDDGKQGYFNPQTADEFKEGEEVTYTFVEKTGKKGKYLVFTLTKVDAPPPSKQKSDDEITLPPLRKFSGAKTIEEMKYEGRVYCFRLAVKCLIAGAIKPPEVKELFNEWVDLMDGSIDELKPQG